jgi:hypothetical protein
MGGRRNRAKNMKWRGGSGRGEMQEGWREKGDGDGGRER